ncbi:MAG: hypothetical protein V3G42_11785 [Oscillospiraceae bacterium]
MRFSLAFCENVPRLSGETSPLQGSVTQTARNKGGKRNAQRAKAENADKSAELLNVFDTIAENGETTVQTLRIASE